MHPVIRIVCYLILALFLARANAAQLLFSALGLALLLLVTRPPQFVRRLGRALYRLKWLFLSIMVLYLWLTPGEMPAAGTVGAGLSGLRMGLMRVAVLVMLIWNVLFAISGLSREQLLGAIYYLLQPLRILQMPVERFALRLALTLQAVAELQVQPAPAPRAQDAAPAWQRISSRINDRFDLVRRRAEGAALEPQALPAVMHPPRWQWSCPLALAAAFAALHPVDAAVWF